MRKLTIYASLISIIIAAISSNRALGQCTITVPPDVSYVTGIDTVSSKGKFYIGNTDSLYFNGSGLNQFYIDSGGFVQLNGLVGGDTIYVKNYATLKISAVGSGYHIYCDTFANIISDTTASVYHCHPIVFEGPVGTPNIKTDSFSVYINSLCGGPQFTITTNAYSASLGLKTWFGDNTIDSSVFSSGYGTGYISFSHSYANSGAYTIKQVLYDGAKPIDSAHYSYNYQLCNTMSVSFFLDINGDCIKDSTEPYNYYPITTEVDSNGIAIDTIIATSGFYYNAYGSPGDIYTFKAISLPGSLYVSCPASGSITDTLGTPTFNPSTQYIALQCASGTNFDLAVSAVVPVSGVRDQWGDIYVSNIGYCEPINATVTLHYSPKYTFTGGYDISSYTDSTIIWNLIGLSSDSSTIVNLFYAVYTNPDSTLVAGYPAKSYYTITPTVGDADTINNFEIIIDTVRAGCDPNEMTVAPSGNISAGTQLQYTINFTNTGNDTAYNIYVMDTLSDNVDIHSLQLVTVSNTMNIAMLQSGGHNIIKFDFPGINLQDSVAAPSQCSGAVIFNINAKAGLPNGTTIFNHAGVFFDYNPVVITDTVENIIGFPASVPAIKNTANAAIYPNPANDMLTIKTDASAYSSFTISNTLGETVIQQKINATQTNVSVKMLPAGIYYVMLKGDGGVKVMKFVKE